LKSSPSGFKERPSASRSVPSGLEVFKGLASSEALIKAEGRSSSGALLKEVEVKKYAFIL